MQTSWDLDPCLFKKIQILHGFYKQTSIEGSVDCGALSFWIIGFFFRVEILSPVVKFYFIQRYLAGILFGKYV